MVTACNARFRTPNARTDLVRRGRGCDAGTYTRHGSRKGDEEDELVPGSTRCDEVRLLCVLERIGANHMLYFQSRVNEG
jgi:hypothetical protein